MNIRRAYKEGFALPTVLIASVVMLSILAVSVTSVAAVRTSLKAQYYEQLAKAAGEAGVAYAKACLSKNGNVPQWSNAKPLTPSTDCSGNQLLDPAVQVLAVGGGGGGGGNHGGGGGGGGVVQQTVGVAAGNYTVIVGAGGSAGAVSATGGTGGNSIFGSSVTAYGGGGGGGRVNASAITNAGSGGAGGGGAGTYVAATGSGAPGAASNAAGQGYAGGMGSAGNSGSYAGNGGGGGGAGGVGGAASGTATGAGISGAGGPGVFSDISGREAYYGAGGAGGRWGAGSLGAPGITGGGIGGNGDNVSGGAGATGLGAGGGGGGSGTTSSTGGAGGSGTVVVRYPNNGSVMAVGGTSYISGAYKVHTFTQGTSTFSVSSTSASSCPTDPRCSVISETNMRSSFSVPLPSLDESGRAVAIANTGYVELLRSSNGAVWRTYRQPAVQVAAVPDLCSGANTSSLGWANAAEVATASTLPSTPTARPIALANTNLHAGRMYFRKDFPVTVSGTYRVMLQAPTVSEILDVYIDGALVAGDVTNTTKNVDLPLSVGCHTITVRQTHRAITSQKTQFSAAIKNSEGSSDAIVVTDKTWRASAGAAVHYSDPDYYMDLNDWQLVTENASPNAYHPDWAATADRFSRAISSWGDNCPLECPADSTGYFRDSKDIIVTTNTEVTVHLYCDDDCVLYLDGEPIIPNSPIGAITRQTLTLTAGAHRFAAKVWNVGAVPNPSSLNLSVIRASDGRVLTRSDMTWRTTYTRDSGRGSDLYSYEASFRPSPNDIPEPVTADFLVVGGGGGAGSNAGGGGGGGSVAYSPGRELKIGTYNVTVGAGGAGGTYNGSSNATNGGNSSVIFQGGAYPGAVGGGAGASRDGGANATSLGTGGGGAGPISSGASRALGGVGVLHMGGGMYTGWNGGAGTPADQGTLSKGGGGGGAAGGGRDATTSAAGDGGAGVITYISGFVSSYGGGGGGIGIPAYGAIGAATDGGRAGTFSTTVAAADANRGGGGGATSGAGTGGAGGSGVVIIRVRTSKVNVTYSGAVSASTTGILGVTYTIYTFTGAGVMTITSYK